MPVETARLHLRLHPQVDHIVGVGDGPSNLRGVCAHCHRVHTAREAAQACEITTEPRIGPRRPTGTAAVCTEVDQVM